MKRLLLSFLAISLAGNGLYAMERNKVLVEPIQQQKTNALTIIDADGQEFSVSLKHYEQAIKCSTIKNMIKDSGDLNNNSITLSKSILATQKNLQQLFDLMANDIQINQLSGQETITLFELTDYLEAKSILPDLAQKTYEIAKSYPASNPDKTRLLLLAASCFGEYDSCGQFIETATQETLKKAYETDNGILNFSYDVIKKKINSFDGIEKITTALKSCDPLAIRIIDMRNQNITHFKVFDLFRVFPNVKQLYLSNNKITQITYNQLLGMPKGFRLYLDNNPISSIEDQCFSNFARFNQCIIFLRGANISLEQEQQAFANNNIQARLQPQGWRARIARLQYHLPTFVGITAAGIGVGSLLYSMRVRENALQPIDQQIDNLDRCYHVDRQMPRDQYLNNFHLLVIERSRICESTPLSYGPLNFAFTMAGIVTGYIGVALQSSGFVRAFFQTRNPYHLVVKTDQNNYNFPTAHHL